MVNPVLECRAARRHRRVDLAFVDGHHLFDYVVTDCLLLGQMLRKGGLLVMDDTTLPGVARACDWDSFVPL
jgi:hypothetical protein